MGRRSFNVGGRQIAYDPNNVELVRYTGSLDTKRNLYIAAITVSSVAILGAAGLIAYGLYDYNRENSRLF